jgi:UDP-glucose 4-epimerase
MIYILGCGYLGYNFTCFLRQRGIECKIIGFPSGYSERLIALYPDAFIERDVVDFCRDNLTQFNGSIIVNAIGFSKATAPVKDIENDLELAYKTNVRLISLLSDNPKIQKYVYLSSGGSIYGSSSQLCKESTLAHPDGIYGLQKLFIENLLRINYNERKVLPYVSVRPSNPYGGFHIGNQGIIDVAIEKLLNDDELLLWAPVTNERDYIYIDDFCEGLLSIINGSRALNMAINLGTGRGTSLSQIFKILETLYEKRIKIRSVPHGTVNVPKSILDVTLLRETTGFIAQYQIEDGIRLYFEKHAKEKQILSDVLS